MNKDLKNRLKRTALMSFVAVLIGAGIGYWQAGGGLSFAPASAIGGDFTLTNDDGQAVTRDTYSDKTRLMYFGYTYCPTVCPTELHKMSVALDIIQEEAPEVLDQLQPLFVTIDPERDTPEGMHQYVELFHPQLVGLSGSRTQIDDILGKYRVYAQKVEDPDLNDYTMDHSSFMYLMNGDDKLMAMYRAQDTAEFMAADIIEHIRK